RRGYRLLPLQNPSAFELARASMDELMTEMHLVTPDGRVRRGVDALLHISKSFWWMVPVRMLARVACARRGMDAMDRVIGRNRRCVLPIGRRRRRLDPDLERELRWAPALTPLALVAVIARGLPAWAYMWLIALAIYFGCKWLMWWPRKGRASLG